MAEFSMQDAAFTGFRVVREHPRALAIWSLYALTLSLAFGAVFVTFMGADFARLMAMSAHPTQDPEAVVALFGRLAPGYAIFAAIGILSNAIFGAAMIRAVMRPSEGRFGYLRVGRDELRQLLLGLLTLAVFLGAYLGLVIVMGIVGGVLALVAKTGQAALVAVTLIVLAGGMIALAVRLSLAPAATFDTGRIDLAGAWALTRGRFWPLFATYLLTVALVAVVYLLSLLVIFALTTVLHGGNAASALTSSDAVTLKAYFAPARLVESVLMAGVSALVWPVMFTPPAAVYRSLVMSGTAAARPFA